MLEENKNDKFTLSAALLEFFINTSDIFGISVKLMFNIFIALKK